MINKSIYSSNKDNWETPPKLFHRLSDLFSYDLDVCADDKNALCDRYFTESDNALDRQWISKSIFCNPPYSKGLQDRFINKIIEEYNLNHFKLLTLLIPARTDTKKFHLLFNDASYILFLKGRLTFYENGIQGKTSAPFPSSIVFFCKQDISDKVYSLNDLGAIIKLKDLHGSEGCNGNICRR